MPLPQVGAGLMTGIRVDILAVARRGIEPFSGRDVRGIATERGFRAAGLGPLAQLMQEDLQAFDEARQAALIGEGEDLKQEMRRQTVAGGLGRKMAQSWQRSKPRGSNQHRQRPVSYIHVFTRARKAMALAETGGTVRPRSAGLLAIPTKAAGTKPNTAFGGGGRGSPRQRKTLEDYIRPGQPHGPGGNIHFVPIAGGRRFVVVRRTRTRSTVLFILARATRHRRRIDFAGAADRALASLPGRLVVEWEKRT